MNRNFYFLLLINLSILLFLCSCSKKSVEPQIYYSLITRVNPADAGKIYPPDTTEYEENTYVEIEATQNNHWLFSHWNPDSLGSENPMEIKMDKDKNITANFSKVQFPLDIDIIGEGNVSERLIPSKLTDYDYGSVVELTAHPDSGWIFDSWSNDLVGNLNPNRITIDTSN